MEPGSKTLTGPSSNPLKYVEPGDVAWDKNATVVTNRGRVIESPTVMQGAALVVYRNRLETTLPRPKLLDAPPAQRIVPMWKPVVVRAKGVPAMEAELPLCKTKEGASAIALEHAQIRLLASFVENEALGTGREPLGRWMYTTVNVIEFRYARAGRSNEYVGVALTPKPSEIEEGDLFFINALEYIPTTSYLKKFDNLDQFQNGHIMVAVICDDGDVDVFDTNGPTDLKVTCANAIGKAFGRGFKTKATTRFKGYAGMLVDSDHGEADDPSQQGMCQIISAVQLFSLRRHQLNPSARLLTDLEADDAQDEFSRLCNSNDWKNVNRYYEAVRREPLFHKVFGDKPSHELSTGDAIRQWSGRFFEQCLKITGEDVRGILDDGAFFQGDAVTSDGANMAEEVTVYCASLPRIREPHFYEVCVTSSMLDALTNFLREDRSWADLRQILRLQFAGHTLPMMNSNGVQFVFQASEGMPDGIGKDALISSLTALPAYDVLKTVYEFWKEMARLGYYAEFQLKIIQAGDIIGPMHITRKDAPARGGGAAAHVII